MTPLIQLPRKTNILSAVDAWCCCRRLSSSPLKQRILFRKKTVYLNSFSHRFMMIHSSAVNKTMENASAFTRSFPSKAEGIALCSAFILSSVLIIAGNFLTLVLFVVTKPLRRKSLFLVMNMAFADLLLGTFSVPFYIYIVGDDYQLWTAEDSLFLVVFKCIDSIFTFGSYLSAASISCERLYAVYWPFKYRLLSTKTYCIAIFILWTFAALSSTMLILLSEFNSIGSALYVSVLVLLALTIIICVCNIAIWRNFQHQSVDSQHRNGASRNRRLTKTLLLVSILALLCWLPLIILNVLIYIPATSIPWKFYFMVNILNYSNSFVNPIVYVFRIPEFQQALRLCCTKSRPAIKTVKIKGRNRTATPRTPEIESRILRNDPTLLQVDVEREFTETKFSSAEIKGPSRLLLSSDTHGRQKP